MSPEVLHKLKNGKQIFTSAGSSQTKLFIWRTRCSVGEKCIIHGTLNECTCKIINRCFKNIVPCFPDCLVQKACTVSDKLHNDISAFSSFESSCSKVVVQLGNIGLAEKP
jgi:hypothetical protein